ncbi:flagellin [Thalassospira povalilytica]|uniref:Flagellin n=1 Tax=Thalassospira povalilytica TaxID=732237 RepID=A0A8I1M4Q1_9PROT|nr:flagellin [Thalassospira povalilytica]MBN8194939.1 flagellin [Thalassospira povalilytica]
MASINTNMSATLAVSNLNKTTDEMTSVLTAMSSGKAINSASDDAAGLAVYTAMSVDYAAWEQAGDNAEVATAILETADGGLSEIADILERMYELASQASSGSVTDTERAYLDDEFQELISQVDSIVESTTYFDTSLLDGTYDENFTVSADASATAISVTIGTDYDSTGLGIAAADVTTSTTAASALTLIETAIETVSAGRASVGAMMSRFDYAAGNIETAKTNLESAMSVYMDADIAQLSADQTELGVKMDSAIQALSVSNENLEKLSRLLS